MAPPTTQKETQPVVQHEGDSPDTGTTTGDSSPALLADSNTNPVTLTAEHRYGPAELSAQSLIPFGSFTLTNDVSAGALAGDSISMEAQLSLNGAMQELAQSLARDVAIENLVQTTETAAIAGNYSQLAQSMAAAYNTLKDDPAAFGAFRDSLQDALEDDHITVDGGAGDGVVGLLLHKEGTATGLEIVAEGGADGSPVVTARGYEYGRNNYLEGVPEKFAQELAAAGDPVLEARLALEISRNMPEIKAMDTDGNGRVNEAELRAHVAKTKDEKAAQEYLIAHFDAIARSTGTSAIDLTNTAALAQFPDLQQALNTTKAQLGDKPMTEANILEARRQWGGNHPNPAMQRQLDQVLQNFDALRIATAPPGSLGISESDRVIATARAAIRGLSESVIRASQNGVTPKPEIDLQTIMNATNNPEQMAKLLPAIINAANDSILRSTNYRFETKRIKGADGAGDRTTVRLVDRTITGGLQMYATSYDH